MELFDVTMQDARQMKRDKNSKGKMMEAKFLICSPDKYDYAQVVHKTPVVIGDFSLDEKRKFCPDRRSRKFITIDWKTSKEVAYDLDLAYDKVKKQAYDRSEKINHILNWLKLQGKGTNDKSLQSLSPDIVCPRGILKNLLCSPYENGDWIICATKYKGTIYLCPYREFLHEDYDSEWQKRMISWGYKFEQYMTESNDVHKGNDENPAYYVVVNSQLGNHSLICSAEIDGLDRNKYRESCPDVCALLELKTNNIHHSISSKAMKWWSQCSILGIPSIICGFRDTNGIVRRLETLRVEDMPSNAQGCWKPRVMMNFLDTFLTFVKRQVIIDNPAVVYKFERKDGSHVINCTYLGHNEDMLFIPQWYIGHNEDMLFIPPYRN